MCPATGNHSSILFRLNDLNDGYGGGAAYTVEVTTSGCFGEVSVHDQQNNQGHDVDHANVPWSSAIRLICVAWVWVKSLGTPIIETRINIPILCKPISNQYSNDWFYGTNYLPQMG